MRILGVSAAVLAALVMGCGDAGSATSQTSLTVTFWPQGRDDGPPKRWTLRCNPVGGTHPSARRACARLASLDEPFAPVPPDRVCTQIYGGPQEALATGTYRGRRIWARFSRKDGCQIARWNRHVPLLPSADA